MAEPKRRIYNTVNSRVLQSNMYEGAVITLTVR